MDTNRPKPGKSSANSSRPAGKQPPPKSAKPPLRTPVRSTLKPRTPAAKPKSRTGLWVAVAVVGVVVIGGAIGAAAAMLGGPAQEPKKNEVAKNSTKKSVETKSANPKADPKADPKSADPKTGSPKSAPEKARGFIVRQENGPEVNPAVEAGPGFRVEDAADAPARPAPPIDVVITEAPKLPKPKPEPEMEGAPTLEAVGPFELGKPFRLRASIVPKAGDFVTLLTPPALKVVKTEPIGQFVLGTAVLAEWQVQVEAPFDAMPIKIALKSGASTERRITVKALKSDVPFTQISIAAGPKENTYRVTAAVENAKPDQKLTLQLPPDVKRIEGEEMAVVPKDEPEKPATVQWIVSAEKTGDFPIVVDSSAGPGAKKVLIVERIATSAKAVGPFTLAFEGDIEPGKTCSLVASLTEPAPGQKLTIEPPGGMTLTEGDATQNVPAILFNFDGVSSKVTWKLRPAAAGRYEVRVVSSTGLEKTRVLVIEAK